MRSIFTLVLACIACLTYSQTPTIVAIGNAKQGSDEGWSYAANWNPARIPGDKDIVEIPSGLTLTVKGPVYTTAPSLTVLIRGTLSFVQSGKLDLGAASIIQIFSGGQIISSGTNSEVIYIGSELKFKGGNDLSPLVGPAFTSIATGTSPSGFSTGVLPVKLKSFTARAQGHRIALAWSTAEEINTIRFVVERSSDARIWSPLQTVAAKGEAADYATTDAAPAIGNNFYRLKTVDLDGKTEYSHVLKVAQSRGLSAYVSPNPASGQVTVSLSTTTTTPVHVQLVAASGEVVREGLFAPGSGLIRLNLQGTTPGIYTLVLRNDASVFEASQLLIK